MSAVVSHGGGPSVNVRSTAPNAVSSAVTRYVAFGEKRIV
jgi:hypothetical protein